MMIMISLMIPIPSVRLCVSETADLGLRDYVVRTTKTIKWTSVLTWRNTLSEALDLWLTLILIICIILLPHNCLIWLLHEWEEILAFLLERPVGVWVTNCLYQLLLILGIDIDFEFRFISINNNIPVELGTSVGKIARFWGRGGSNG